jgi:hypothetical protein
MSTVRPTTATDVTILAASAVTGPHTRPIAVFVGTLGVDGTTGATPMRSPGDELRGQPMPAVGAVLERGSHPTVVYAEAILEKGATVGQIYGTWLTVRGHGETKEFFVPSPTILCSKSSAHEATCANVVPGFLAELQRLLAGRGQ